MVIVEEDIPENEKSPDQVDVTEESLKDFFECDIDDVRDACGLCFDIEDLTVKAIEQGE